ncbi:MAG: hypothetical protein GW938_03945 [Leptospira sp.]|nr:hypothetical protein [Leptospira sp.]NCS93992.1 hypothetical protein [Leptospira sp.]
MKSIQILSLKSHIILILLWGLNDLVLKIQFPGFITGKISDLIGIYLSPFIMTAILKLLLRKIEEKTIFYFSTSIVLCFFLLINLSLTLNDTIYKSIDIGLGYSGYADFSDLLCLPILIVSILSFKYILNHKTRNNPRYLVLLLSFAVFINSPSEPTGRSDLISLLALLSLAEDKIYLLEPNENTILNDTQTFLFRFVGKNNESSPSSIDKIIIPDDCTSVNSDPILTDEVNIQSSRNEPFMKFLKYKVSIYDDVTLTNLKLSQVCEENSCNIETNVLGSGKYFWEVRLQYRYIKDCKLYEYFEKPEQDSIYFNK